MRYRLFSGRFLRRFVEWSKMKETKGRVYVNMLNEIFISESSENTGPLVLFVMFAVEFLSPQEGLLLLLLVVLIVVTLR